MTGIGLGEAPLNGGTVRVELRAVNHRHLDVRIRATPELSDAVSVVEEQVRAACTRGRIEANVRWEAPPGADGFRYDLTKARAYYTLLVELRNELAPDQEVPITALAHIPGVFGLETHFAPEAREEAARLATRKAAADLDVMRLREGQGLAEDLRKRLTVISQRVRAIEERRPVMLDAARERLQRRISKLLDGSDVAVDPARLAQEVAWFADKSDVAEELTRLESHLAQFRTLIQEAGEGTGKRLDFLLQEMGREANTTGAKANDSTIAHAVVEIKAELERLREQVQNVL